MALRINQTITTREGFSVDSGTYVTFNTIFPSGTLETHYNMRFYRNETSYTEGESNYYPIELSTLGYVNTAPYNEFTGLTPTLVHQNLKNYLSTVYTAGTIDILI